MVQTKKRRLSAAVLAWSLVLTCLTAVWFGGRQPVHAADQPITEINIDGIVPPAVGAVPGHVDYSTGSADYSINRSNWLYEAAAGEWKAWANQPFEAGKKYAISFLLDPAAGKTFEHGQPINFTVGGQPVNNGRFRLFGTSAVVQFEYTLPMPIDRVDLTGLKAPALGEHPSTAVQVPDGMRYRAAKAIWFKTDTSGEEVEMLEVETFKAGVRYVFTALIQPTELGVFKDQQDVPATLNGKPAQLLMHGPDRILRYEFEPLKEAPKSPETKPNPTKPNPTKPTQTKPTQSKPTQSKPTQSKPTQSKPTQSKPSATAPAGNYKLAVFRAGFQKFYRTGETVGLAARAEGGKGPYRYQFFVLRSNGARVNLTSLRAVNTFDWRPENPDNGYRVGVDVVDANGKKLTQMTTVKVVSKSTQPKPNQPKPNQTKPTQPKSTQPKPNQPKQTQPAPSGDYKLAVFRAGFQKFYRTGETVGLAARAEGGKGPYRYQFFVLRSSGARVNLTSLRAVNTFDWRPENPDNGYRVGVDVVDANGKKLTKMTTVKVVKR